MLNDSFLRKLKKFKPEILEIKKKLTILIGCFLILYLIGYIFSKEIFKMTVIEDEKLSIVFKSLIGSLFFNLNIAKYFSTTIIIPILILLILDFCLPALYKKERKVLLFICISSIFLFYISLILSIKFIIPFIIKTEIKNGIKIYIDANEYLNQVFFITLITLILFLLPVIFGILIKSKIINKKNIKKYNKHIYLAIFIITAILTPADILYQVTLSIILIAIYNLILFIF